MFIAIEGERKSLLNYLDFALNTDEEKAKDMFILLVRDEFNHFEILNTEIKAVKETGRFIQPEFTPSEIVRITPNLKKVTLERHEPAEIGEKQAVDTALDLEDEAKNFYREQALKSQDPHAREMRHKLADMEEAHYQLLMSQTHHLRETGYWLNIKEFSLEVSKD